jgi:hypothetical protein
MTKHRLTALASLALLHLPVQAVLEEKR